MDKLPDWVRDQQAVREAEEAVARREAYDGWGRQYADCGVRVDDDEPEI
jgi:hypothetical protein